MRLKLKGDGMNKEITKKMIEVAISKFQVNGIGEVLVDREKVKYVAKCGHNSEVSTRAFVRRSYASEFK